MDTGRSQLQNVETINVSVIDGLIQTPKNIAPDTQNLTLVADTATKITVDGRHGAGFDADDFNQGCDH